MIPPEPSAPPSQQIAGKKKGARRRLWSVAVSATSEHVLHADRQGRHVRARSKTAVGAGALVRCRSRSVPGRASNVVIVRADPVIDLVVDEVHLGALGHDV